ncbi:MAG: B3/4 protein, partial [uncultured bacterium]
FDLDKLTLPATLKFAEGGELFYPLMAGDKAMPLMKGELCYFDANEVVLARDFNYLDSDRTKVTEETTNLLLNIDGNDACTLEDVDACLTELEELLKEHCGGELSEKVLVEAKM